MKGSYSTVCLDKNVILIENYCISVIGLGDRTHPETRVFLSIVCTKIIAQMPQDVSRV